MVAVSRLLAMIANASRYLKGWFSWFGSVEGLGGVLSFVSSMVCFGVFLALLKKLVVAMNGAKADSISAVSGFGSAAGSVDTSFLAKVNFILPVDTLFSLLGLYISVWVGVQTFLKLKAWMGVSSIVAEKMKGQ